VIETGPVPTFFMVTVMVLLDPTVTFPKLTDERLNAIAPLDWAEAIAPFPANIIAIKLKYIKNRRVGDRCRFLFEMASGKAADNFRFRYGRSPWKFIPHSGYVCRDLESTEREQ